jgi:hypothetical protein
MPSIRFAGQTVSEEVEKPLVELASRMDTYLICPLCKQPMEIDVYVEPPQIASLNNTYELEVMIYAACHTHDCARRKAW